MGAVVPVLPVVFGARTLLPSLIVAGGVIVLVSTILAFLSGMDVKRRIALNLGIIAAAVAISYVIGLIAKAAWGISRLSGGLRRWRGGRAPTCWPAT